MSDEFEWIYRKNEGFTQLRLPVAPSPSAKEVLVRPKWVGICGSDHYAMEIHDGWLRPGHEWLGVIERVGTGVGSLAIGDVVTSTATFGCLECEACRQGRTNLCDHGVHLGSDRLGAIRTWMLASAGNLVKVGIAADGIRRDQVLHEVFAVAEETLKLVNENLDRREKRILILGGGTVGLCVALLAREIGFFPVLVDKNRVRVELAQKKGIEGFMFSQALIDPKFARSFPVVVDAASDFNSDTGAFKYLPVFLKQDFLAVMLGKYVHLPETPRGLYRMNGKMVWMSGVSLNTLTESVARWDSELPRLADAIISHTFPTSAVNQAFEVARNRSESIKVVIEI